jgi:hypothetical protein
LERFGDQIVAQLEALTKQFATMGGANGCLYQPNPRFVEDDDGFTIKKVRFQRNEARFDAQDQHHTVLTVVSKPQIHLM